MISLVYTSISATTWNMAYPFFLESKAAFHANLNQAIQKSIAEDVTLLFGGDNTIVFRRIMAEVSESAEPYTVNMEKLANMVGTNKVNLYNLMDRINDTGILRALKAADKHAARKPQKLIFNNPNILVALSKLYGSVAAEGTLRESFFCSMFQEVRCLKHADYQVHGINFEIGGKHKTRGQSLQEGSGITLVDIDITFEKDKAPLWLVGFIR